MAQLMDRGKHGGTRSMKKAAESYPRSSGIMWSSDIIIANITLRYSPFWTLHPYDCKNVTIRNVTILAPLHHAPNTDGIDPGKLLFISCSNQHDLRFRV